MFSCGNQTNCLQFVWAGDQWSPLQGLTGLPDKWQFVGGMGNPSPTKEIYGRADVGIRPYMKIRCAVHHAHARQFPFVGRAVPADNFGTGSRVIVVAYLISPDSLRSLPIPVYRGVSLETVGATIGRPATQIVCNLCGFQRKIIDYRLAAM